MWALSLSRVWNAAQTSAAGPCGEGSYSGPGCLRLNTCGQPPEERPLLSSGLLAAVTAGQDPQTQSQELPLWQTSIP